MPVFGMVDQYVSPPTASANKLRPQLCVACCG